MELWQWTLLDYSSTKKLSYHPGIFVDFCGAWPNTCSIHLMCRIFSSTKLGVSIFMQTYSQSGPAWSSLSTRQVVVYQPQRVLSASNSANRHVSYAGWWCHCSVWISKLLVLQLLDYMTLVPWYHVIVSQFIVIMNLWLPPEVDQEHNVDCLQSFIHAFQLIVKHIKCM